MERLQLRRGLACAGSTGSSSSRYSIEVETAQIYLADRRLYAATPPGFEPAKLHGAGWKGEVMAELRVPLAEVTALAGRARLARGTGWLVARWTGEPGHEERVALDALVRAGLAREEDGVVTLEAGAIERDLAGVGAARGGPRLTWVDEATGRGVPHAHARERAWQGVRPHAQAAVRRLVATADECWVWVGKAGDT